MYASTLQLLWIILLSISTWAPAFDSFEYITGSEFLDHMGFPGSSAGKESTWNAGDHSSIAGSGISPREGIGYPLQYSWASLVVQLVKNTSAMRETWVWSLNLKDPLEEGIATHSSILAWRIPMDKEPGGLVHGVTELDMTERLSMAQHMVILFYTSWAPFWKHLTVTAVCCLKETWVDWSRWQRSRPWRSPPTDIIKNAATCRAAPTEHLPNAGRSQTSAPM